jgi:hypothetical protein
MRELIDDGVTGFLVDIARHTGFRSRLLAIGGRDGGCPRVAVHAAARVMTQCQSNELLVSRVVTDLVARAGLKFSERGSHELKGLPGRWELFAASE